MKAMSTAYPIENTKHRLEVSDLKWDGPERYSLKEQKQAVMRGDTLERKLTGTWSLVDKATGQVVDKKQTTIAHLPWATDRGTFVYRGNEYVIANQTRLRPGVYARVKDNGILEAHVNAKGGTGPSFRLYMEPDTGVFRLAVGQSTLKLYPLLKEMGVTDKQISASWGDDLLRKNIEADDPRAVQRAFHKLVGAHEEAVKEE
jgi:DNA-directed RNA polymerase beta subunit